MGAATAPRLELMEITEQTEPPQLSDMAFTREDCRRVSYPHSDPLVVVIDIADQSVHRVLLDSGAKVNVIYKSCWDEMDLDEKALKRSTTSIVGFSDESVLAEGKMSLPVTITDKIIEEVQKLLDAGFIEEWLYPEWLANVVLVKKP